MAQEGSRWKEEKRTTYVLQPMSKLNFKTLTKFDKIKYPDL